MKFEYGKNYPIEMLPDDLYDENIPHRDRWALKGAMFWNDCQGWWHERISEYWLINRCGKHLARFWAPEPPDPMSREEILSERGLVVCPECDYAVEDGIPHNCRPSDVLLKERELQQKVDAS